MLRKTSPPAGLLRVLGTAFLILSAAAVGSASAQQSASGLPEYHVELVVFRTLVSNATPEQWSLEAGAAGQRLEIPDEEPAPFGTTDQTTAAASTASFPPLASSKTQLGAIYDALRRSRNYQPLAHIGWTQPGYPRNAAQHLSLTPLVRADTGLTGQVALSRGRYLHLTLDLVYDSPPAEGEAGQRFVLRQSRRMRSGERHYIDHPRFGVIALVRPAE